MAEKSYFRIRNGEIEIEYEGPVKEANERYENAIEWLTSRPKKKKTKREKGEEGEKEGAKKDKRGGFRKTIYSGKITELVEEGFFQKQKSLDEVIKALQSKNVPTRGLKSRTAILNNLRRRIGNKKAKLKGMKENDVWYFWVD